jgi:hypothetical protein
MRVSDSVKPVLSLRWPMILAKRRRYGWLVAGGIATACLLPEMDTKLRLRPPPDAGREAGSAGASSSSESNAGSRGTLLQAGQGGSAGVGGAPDAGSSGSLPAASCSQGRVLCGDNCENLETDPTNCGTCGQD